MIAVAGFSCCSQMLAVFKNQAITVSNWMGGRVILIKRAETLPTCYQTAEARSSVCHLWVLRLVIFSHFLQRGDQTAFSGLGCGSERYARPPARLVLSQPQSWGTTAATALGHICMRRQNVALIRHRENQASATRVKIQREAARAQRKALAQTDRRCVLYSRQ